MQPSLFNVRVPLPDRDEVFLLNTFSDAQLLVSTDVVRLLDSLESAGTETRAFTPEERDALNALAEQGFLVTNRAAERANLEQFFHDFREDTGQLRLTVLTTLQCNFACDYCIQGDHGDYNKHAHKMSLDTAARVAAWAETQMDALRPSRFVLTFFGGEPLLNLPVMYALAERLHASSTQRGVQMLINVITNGLLLTPEVVARLKPLGLNGVKITLDGDRETHDRQRPLRGGQGTFDRIIRNIRQIAGECQIAIGGNFDVDTVDSYPALLDFLKAQDFADAIGKVAFKPVIRTPQMTVASTPAPATSVAARSNVIPLTLVSADAPTRDKPLGGTCMTAAGSSSGTHRSPSSGGTSACDSCHFVDDKMAFLRDETKRRGFPTIDGLHMGPCELHRKHAYTIGPDGDLYTCPGFAGDASLSVGQIGQTALPAQTAVSARFDALGPWRACGDCSFIPVCAGGCSVAAHAELGDFNTPSCHKRSFEAAVVSLAEEAARHA